MQMAPRETGSYNAYHNYKLVFKQAMFYSIVRYRSQQQRFFFISALVRVGMTVQLLPNNRYIFVLKQYEAKHFPAINS